MASSKYSVDFHSLDQSRNSVKGLDPTGFSPYSNDSSKVALKDKTAEDEKNIVTLRLKSIPMNAFMLWMSGNSVQIFSILITVMLFVNAAKAIAGTKQGCVHIVSIRCHGLGVWKCGAMGLLPTAQSDWLAFLEPKTIVEFTSGGSMWK
ncbi:hypothetical protein BC829DRAFT_440320 [Chytridium lagenaria]|nr:hypothetical protein BC829DRAFT_440320 [Chytridium lagenaria]